MLSEQYERQNLEKFLIGTLFDEDELEKKTNQYNQIARDDKGHKRFHGAFTGMHLLSCKCFIGGFQAGYNNTVGSKDGWVPSQFYSSRTQRGQIKQQSVLDFMDEEDLGESIAGKDLLAQNQFNTVGLKNGNEQTTILQQIQNELLVAQPNSFGEQIFQNVQKEKRKEELHEIIEKQVGLIQTNKMYGPAFEQLEQEKKMINSQEHTLYDPLKNLYFLKENVSFKNNYYGLGYDETFQKPQDEEEAFEKEFFTLIKKQNKTNLDDLDENQSKQHKQLHLNNIFGNNENAYEKEDIIQYENGKTEELVKITKGPEAQKSNFSDFKSPQAYTLKEIFGEPQDRLKISLHGTNLIIPENYTPSFHSKQPIQQPQLTQKLTHKDREQLLEGHQSPSPNQIKTIEQKQQLINSKFLKDILRGERTFIQSGIENQQKPAATSEGNLLGMRMRTVVQWVPNGLLCRRFNVTQINKEQTVNKKVKQNSMAPPMFFGNREEFFMFQNDLEQELKKEEFQSKFQAKEILDLNQENKSQTEPLKEEEDEKQEQEEEEKQQEVQQIQLQPEVKQKRDLFESIFGDDEE